MIRAALVITLLVLAATTLRAGDPFTNATDPVDMEALFPSEEGLVRIEVPGVDARDFLARFMGDTLFVPFTSLCDFLRIKSTISPDQNHIEGELAPEGQFTISRITNTAEIGTRSIHFTPASIRIVGGEVYLEQSLFMDLLGLAAYYDPANLKLRISPDAKIPVVQWKHSEERYGLLATHGRETLAAVDFPIERSAFGAPALNWMLTNSLNGKIVSSSASLFYGQQFLWGTLQLTGSGSFANSVPGSMPHAHLDAARWFYQMPNSSLMTQVQLGSIELSDGARVQGVGLTNTPLTPRTGFSNYQLRGLTQPGWTVELYDGNHLVDVTRADEDGRYAFKILMEYGTVDRTTREVGPYGESIVNHHRLEFNQNMIPAGELEYDVRYGADSLSMHSRGFGSARVGFGVFDRLTLGAEVMYHTDSVLAWRRDSVAPRALASLWLGESSSLALDYAVRTKLVGAAFSTSGAENTALYAAIDSFSIDRHTFRATAEATMPFGPISVGGNAMYAKYVQGHEYAAEPQISGYVGGISFIGATRFAWRSIMPGEITVPGLISSTSPDITSSLRIMYAPTGGLLLSATGRYNVRSHEMAQLDFATYYQLSETFGLTVNYSAPRLDWKNGLVQAQLNVNLNAIRATVSSFYQSGMSSTSSYAQGGALISSHGVKLYADPVVGQAAVIVDAFNDRNGNGLRDDGEEFLDAPKAHMTMAGTETMSEDGMFRLLPANRECHVEVDRWSFASEDLYPSRTVYDVYTLPSGVHSIEVPFSHGYDLSGRCGIEGDSVRGNEASSFLNGLRVHLSGPDNGSTYEGEVFSDGTIFVPGVAAGTYHITFDSDQLAARRLCPPAIEGSVTVSATDHRIPATLFRRCSK